ncbi:MAG: DUF5655 domain-containing protein [Anaerolineae bacterium]
MLRTPDEMRAAIIRNLPDKTGRSLEAWVSVLQAEGPSARQERIAWLKQVHHLGHFQAQMVVDKAEQPGGGQPVPPEDLVAAQYAGAKAPLRAIHDHLVEMAQELGADVRIEARKTYVSLSRRRQFGVIQASTRMRVDLGLALPGVEPSGRLEPAARLGNERISHRVALTGVDEVDEEVRAWLDQAYRLEG